MALTNVIKGVPFSQVFHRITIDDVEHLFVENKSGSIVHINGFTGKSTVVINSVTANDYFYTAYSQLSNCFYINSQNGDDLLEYNPTTGEVHSYQIYNEGGTIYFGWSQPASRYNPVVYNPLMSTDGHIYLGQYPTNNIQGYTRFNVITKQFDEWSINPDKEFTHIHGRKFNDAFYIDNGALAGVYSTYRWSDTYIDLRDTILSEIATAGLPVVDTGTLWLHQDDREVVSAKRRILYNVGTPSGNKIIDIKSPSTWINSPANTNQAGTPVSTTNWITGVRLYDLAVQAGLTVPTLDVQQAYCVPRKVGRFVYVGHYYLGNKTHFFVFAINPITKEAMYPYSFNKYETYLQSSIAIYKCNFRGDYGFSSSDELVGFITGAGVTYFIRPDNNTFVAYNPISDPDDYVIRAVNLNSITDPDGFGVYHEPRFSLATVQTIGGEDWYVDNNPQSKVALSTEYIQEIDQSVADLSYKFLPDKTKPNEQLSVKVKGLWASSAGLTQALVVGTNKIICVGEVYNGASFINVIDANTFTLKKYEGRMISPDGAIKTGNYVLIYGYSGTTHIFDISDWNDIKRYDITTGNTNEVTYMVSRPEGVLSLGQSSRSAKHHEGCAFSLVNLTSKTVTDLSTKFPNEFIRTSAINLRNAIGLGGASYPDSTVESAVQSFMSSQSLTREQVINLFKNTSRWHNADAHTYGNKTVVGLAYEGILGLNGIRIETTPGSGVWVGRDYYQNEGGKALLIETNNILNLQPSEIKPVQFNLTPNVQSMGRVAGSNLRLAFIVNDPDNQRGIVRVVTKAAFESAANGSGIITSLEREIIINFNGGDGYGFGDANDFDQYDTHCSNAYFCVGDILYITCRSNSGSSGNFPCVLKITLNDGSVETFVESPTRKTRAISYDGDRMLITNGTELVINDDFKTQVGTIFIN